MAENVIQCSTACTVTIQLESAPPSEERIADMSDLWTLFLVVIIVVFCLRKLYDIFDRAPHGE